jgi:hypothetical protein
VAVGPGVPSSFSVTLKLARLYQLGYNIGEILRSISPSMRHASL